MGRHIQGKDGKMRGSIGDGKTHIPSAGNSPPIVEQEAPASSPSLDDVQRLYHERIRVLAVETDTELADLHGKLFRAEQMAYAHLDHLHYALGHRRVRNARGGQSYYEETAADTLQEARSLVANPEGESAYRVHQVSPTLAQYDEEIDKIREIKPRIRQLDEIYRQHYWTRAFLVPGGHVHSSMDCSTCNRGGNDTDFAWLPQYSGSDETQIVEDAGERACTVCYPTAPVDVLQRPTRIFSDEERAQLEAAEERRAQREANRAARAAKAPTASGEPLVLQVGERTWRGETHPRVVELKTERSAITYAVDIVAAQQSGHQWHAPYEVSANYYDVTRDAIVDAITEKRGVDRSEVVAEVEKKAEAKVRRASR